MKTLSKHTKYRLESNEILICQCKELLDFKLDLKLLDMLKRVERGIEFSSLQSSEEKLFLNELNKIGALAELKIQPIQIKDYFRVYIFLDKNLKLTRTKEFLTKKLKIFPQYFKGLYLDGELIGAIQGFPREDYILISEIAIDERFRNRGFGHLLIKAFEKEIKTKEKIKVGAQDGTVNFYKSIGYQPSIFMQVKKENFDKNQFKGYKVIYQKEYDGIIGFEIVCKEVNLNLLNRLKKKFNPLSVQYLFSSQI